MVQNIDPVYLLGPMVTFGFSVALVLFWAFKRRFSASVLLYSLVAYAGAIALKYAIQIPTAKAVADAFGASSVATGLYYGTQTMILEVGLAYVVARFAVSRDKFVADDGEGYGIGLSFWENGVLLGLLSLVSLAADYVILAGGSPALSQQVYQQLLTAEPQLFSPPLQALPSIGFGILERLSSTLLHFSWGYLTLMAACFRRRSLLLLALPMGLVDSLVPLAGALTVPVFEAIVFALALTCLVASLASTRDLRKNMRVRAAP